LDDQTHPRIKVETEAVLAVLTVVQSGEIHLLSSEVLEYEIRRIPNESRRKEAMAMLALAKIHLELDDDVEILAESFERFGIHSMDAMHLAFASTAKADFFSTTDDQFLRKAQQIQDLECKVLSMFELIQEVVR
jgi:predicted nucleic acid-binding protein